ncbi:hydrogenase maturation protease [Haloactinomyces albus]|uniref:Hydrogenase maturation protease n=1 Tax=Haloactinomyces albus TaxID=1352928 RepID=A0AAE4CMW6_9ACTN|nr:hydrogenase maturation protease [Haloactinomyces albus]MDR7300043.1 hydrogenase maturation protease [Haloactinomyces albus]
MNTMGDWADLQEPGPATVVVNGVALGRGSRVRLRPLHRADIVDLTLVDRTAEVERVERDAEGRTYVVVMLDGDPGRDLGAMSQIGHRFFFTPEELEPLGEVSGGGPPGSRILVAGLGDTFLADCAFGPEVIDRMRQRHLPQGVHVVDFGIRMADLARSLQDDYDAAVLLSTASRGCVPGTLSVTEPGASEIEEAAAASGAPDSLRALALAHRLGTRCRRILLVDCAPVSSVNSGDNDVDTKMSTPVREALDDSVPLVESLLDELLAVRESKVGK